MGGRRAGIAVVSSPVGWLFGSLVLAVGVANLLLVHPVPGFAYLMVSLVYLPPANRALHGRWVLSIPSWVKLLLGVALVVFTLGVSDLGDMLD